jgi:hypothetical protein
MLYDLEAFQPYFLEPLKSYMGDTNTKVKDDPPACDVKSR